MASNVGSNSNSSDLSLKLRTGSNGSRDSFYLDFDRGIDSDIEELSATHSGYLLGLDDYYVPKAEAEEVDVVVEAEVESGGVRTRTDSPSSVELQERKLLVQRFADDVVLCCVVRCLQGVTSVLFFLYFQGRDTVLLCLHPPV